ncbi:MAG TPA: hypothetical protein VMY37_33730 [Thermoguttaceae bacterium]|nr:hypothetical protein [Thermoguttaceae bacterium]
MKSNRNKSKGVARMSHQPFVLAYLGPETFVPLLSVIAGAVGILLAFGKNVWSITAGILRGLVRLVVRK